MITAILFFLLGAFVIAILDHFIWPGFLDALDVRIFGKPMIVVNINEIQPLMNAQHLENFSLIFGTMNSQGTILAVQKGQPELNKVFGDAPIPTDFGRNGNNLEYFIGIINKGNRKARDIILTFSGDTLKTDYNIDVDKRIDFVNCGGSGSDYICDVRKKVLSPNEKVGMFVRAKTPSVADVNFKAKGNYDYFVNFRKFYARIINQGESVQMFLDKNEVAKLPPLNSNSNYLQYYYSPQENKWVTL